MTSFSRESNGLNNDWLGEFVSKTVTAAELNSHYASDIIESIESKEFSTIEAALDDFKTRTGFTVAETKDITKMVYASLDPKIASVISNIEQLSKAKKIALAKTVAAGCDFCEHATCVCGRIPATVAKAAELTGILSLASEECTEEEKKEEKKEEKEEVEASAACSLEKKAFNKEMMNKVKEIRENSGCSQAEAVKKYYEGSKTKDVKEPEAEKGQHQDAKASINHRSEWEAFFKSAYFQGSKEETHEGKVTSNDPEKLGYKTKEGIEYDRKPMETTAPGGQDSRPAEQKAFEGAAAKTKPKMGPGDGEKDLKKHWQRLIDAKRANPLEKKAENKSFFKVAQPLPSLDSVKVEQSSDADITLTATNEFGEQVLKAITKTYGFVCIKSCSKNKLVINTKVTGCDQFLADLSKDLEEAKKVEQSRLSESSVTIGKKAWAEVLPKNWDKKSKKAEWKKALGEKS
jgi:hypothetical protein